MRDIFSHWVWKQKSTESRSTDVQSEMKPGSPISSDGERRTIVQLVWETMKVVVISLAIVLPIRYFIFQPFSVEGQSMEPNFHNSDYLIIDEISLRLRPLERGEVVVFRYPYEPSEYYIKRLIGLPGERVTIKDNTITVYNTEHPNGLRLHESYIPQDVRTIVFDNSLDLTLGKDEYFLLGDNRQNSSDSRIFGPVARKYLIGRVWLRGWPLDRLQVFNHSVAY